MATTNLRAAFGRRLRAADGSTRIVDGGPEAERAFAETQLLQKQLLGNTQASLGSAWEQASKLAADRIQQTQQNDLARSSQSADQRQKQDALNLSRQTAESKARLDAGNLRFRARDAEARNDLTSNEQRNRAEYNESQVGLQERSANWKETGPMDERATSLLKEARGMNLTDEGKRELARLSSSYNKIQSKRSSLRPKQYNELMGQWMDKFEQSRLHNLKEKESPSISQMIESGAIHPMGNGTYWTFDRNGEIQVIEGGDMGAGSVQLSRKEYVQEKWKTLPPDELPKRWAEWMKIPGNEKKTMDDFIREVNVEFDKGYDFAQAQGAMAAGRTLDDPTPGRSGRVLPPPTEDLDVRRAKSENYFRKMATAGTPVAPLPPRTDEAGRVISDPPPLSPEQMQGLPPQAQGMTAENPYSYKPGTPGGMLDVVESMWDNRKILGGSGAQGDQKDFRLPVSATEDLRKQVPRGALAKAKKSYSEGVNSLNGEGTTNEIGKSVTALHEAMADFPETRKMQMGQVIDDHALEQVIKLGFKEPVKHLLDAATAAAKRTKYKNGNDTATPNNYLLMSQLEKNMYRGTTILRRSDLDSMQPVHRPDTFFDENLDLNVLKSKFNKLEHTKYLEQAAKEYKQAKPEKPPVSHATAMGMGMGGGPPSLHIERKPEAKKKKEAMEALVEASASGDIGWNIVTEVEKTDAWLKAYIKSH